MFVEQEKANHAVALMCRLFGVSKSGYYAWRERPPSARTKSDTELLVLIKSIHEESRGIYGAPRIHAELRLKYHICCSNKRVARLESHQQGVVCRYRTPSKMTRCYLLLKAPLRQAGPVGIHRRKLTCTTQRDPKREAYPDLVERQFTADKPNKVWVADVTQHETSEGWLYLAVVLDMYSRLVVGWSMGERFTAELVLTALEMALWNRQPEQGVIHHSDHGSQYTSLAFGQGLERATGADRVVVLLGAHAGLRVKEMKRTAVG